jgi:SSS family solute:Na+ symporter
MLWGILGWPFVLIICGYALIPFFMKLPITSAYEILQKRLGTGVRLTASVIFVFTRLVWMALLIYLAAKAVVVMVGWPESVTPLVVIVAGLIAVLYTAMGGLRAVVITDVIQFFVLLLGAIITIIFVSIETGVEAWLPTSWAPHWDTVPFFSWNPVVRVTIIGSIIGTATWWLFTCGSDQVVIQRFLATRNTKAARRALFINCLISLAISAGLLFVGFSILGYFRANPQAIPDGKNLFANADFLFPHYIANFLPAGVAGLVIAAMFAAAMSSLDSGINSIVTVFYTDFLSRFRKGSDSREHNVKLARYLVLGIGFVVVLLSAPVGNVPGNITEVTNKTNGLFVAPLFGLFFMCLFVRFSTPFGAIVGALYGFAFAFIWGFWDVLTGGPMLSFQWIYLFPFIVHVVVGSLVSLLPTRGKSWSEMTLWTLVAIAPIAVCFLLITQ